MTHERIAELKALCDAATPGPWRQDYERVIGNGEWIEDVATAVYTGPPRFHEQRFHDAALIAAARTALPEALAEIERLRAQVAELEAEVEGLNYYVTYHGDDL